MVTPPINAHLLHLHAGVDAVAEPSMHIQLAGGASDLIEAAVAELGLEVGGMDTPIGIDPDSGRPWRPRFDAKTLVPRGADAPGGLLHRLRLSDRHARLRGAGDAPGCLSVTRSEDGLVMRHRVRSTAYKGKPTRGEPEEWVTIAPVAEAIAVLERLTRARRRRARASTHSGRCSRMGPPRRATSPPRSSASSTPSAIT